MTSSTKLIPYGHSARLMVGLTGRPERAPVADEAATRLTAASES